MKKRTTDALKQRSQIRVTCDCGKTAGKVNNITKINEQLKFDLESAKREVVKYKKLVDFSTSQTASLLELKRGNQSEDILASKVGLRCAVAVAVAIVIIIVSLVI